VIVLYLVWVLNADAPPVVSQTTFSTPELCQAAASAIMADREKRDHTGNRYSPEIKVAACLRTG
jgi:hypothetical protein